MTKIKIERVYYNCILAASYIYYNNENNEENTCETARASQARIASA